MPTQNAQQLDVRSRLRLKDLNYKSPHSLRDMAEPQGAPPASSASGVNRLRGHLGHLTQEESAALDNFKSISTEAGFYTPPGLDKKASHDDGTLVYVTNLFHAFRASDLMPVALADT